MVILVWRSPNRDSSVRSAVGFGHRLLAPEVVESLVTGGSEAGFDGSVGFVAPCPFSATAAGLGFDGSVGFVAGGPFLEKRSGGRQLNHRDGLAMPHLRIHTQE
jgi:hypothetical protein